MKNIIFISFMLLFVICGIASAGMFGPTEPTAAPGKYSLGAGYFYDYTKWKTNGPDVRTESNQGYAQGSFAPTKNFDLFGRLGGADLKAEGKANAKLFGTLGGKAIFYQDSIAALGVFGQGTYHFEDYNTGVVKVKDYHDVQAGLSAQVKMQDFIIYGGGFWYYARAKADTGLDSATLWEKTPFGAFMGMKIPFTKEVSLSVEGQYRDSVSAGAFVCYAF